MAVIDDTRGVLVVRIVYDGPALSGKTTSLKALARGVSREVTTPQENAGRTVYFDWVDYVGGLFDGRQIRCQLISVPGQLELAERRQLLIDTADVVVMVLDTREHEWAFSLDWLKRTAASCRTKDPPVGLVLQANKRDAPDAVPDEEMRTTLAKIAPIAVVPSTATTGEGIREAFVLAVRLALDRVRALATSGRLVTGRPDEDTPEELLARLNGAEAAKQTVASPAVAEELVRALDESEGLKVVAPPPPRRPLSSAPPPPTETGEEAFVPDPMMPGGMIWPPVDGRALLHEVATLNIRPKRNRRSDWAGSGSGFRFFSSGEDLFLDLQDARNELLEWARLHTANAQHLTTGRAVILADAGAGRLRLWQIVRSEATLRERLAVALFAPDPEHVARELLAVGLQLAAARDFFSSTTISLPCTLWTVGSMASARPSFAGLMPPPDSQLPAEPTGPELIKRELSPHLRELRRMRIDYGEVVSGVVALTDNAQTDTHAEWIAELVKET